METNYFLALEKRPGDYNIIDVNKLDINNFYVDNSLASIDTFTLLFTEQDIKSSIERANLAGTDYLNGNLRIISDHKHNFMPLVKSVYDNIMNFKNDDSKITNNYKNRLYGSYKKIADNMFEDENIRNIQLGRFKNALTESNKELVFSIISELPYEKSRVIYYNLNKEIELEKTTLKLVKSND